MQHWLVSHWWLLHLYNEFTTQPRLAWSSSWGLVNTSLCVRYSFTGYQYDGASNSHCAASCIPSSMGRVQRIWRTLLNPLVPVECFLAFMWHRRPTSHCHCCAQSLVSVPAWKHTAWRSTDSLEFRKRRKHILGYALMFTDFWPLVLCFLWATAKHLCSHCNRRTINLQVMVLTKFNNLL